MNKVDDVLFSLLKAKEDITKKSNINKNDNAYKEVINGLDNIISAYTINNKMSNKEILDCALSIYGNNNKSYLDKFKSLFPNRIIKNFKERINNYHKKKENKQQFEKEIVFIVKERLKKMIDDDKKIKNHIDNIVKDNNIVSKKNISINENSIDNTIVNNGIINNGTPNKNLNFVPIYNKDVVELMDLQKTNNFIYKDEDSYKVYRTIDNKNKETNINKINVAKFDCLGQAILYAINDKLSFNDVITNFDKLKDNYGNLATYVTDKRNLDNYNNINIVNNINKTMM